MKKFFTFLKHVFRKRERQHAKVIGDSENSVAEDFTPFEGDELSLTEGLIIFFGGTTEQIAEVNNHSDGKLHEIYFEQKIPKLKDNDDEVSYIDMIACYFED